MSAIARARTALACTVRGCAGMLRVEGARLVCAGGHAFDLARSGYANVLQPQDRKSVDAGDSKEAVAARRRLADAGVGAPLRDALADVLVARELTGAESVVLDVGCGEGTHLDALRARLGFEAWGADLSIPAIEAASKRYPECAWVVLNADRGLAFGDASLDAILSITARRNRDEFRRVLRPGGRVLFALPAADDLHELRAAVHGEATERDRAAKLAADLAPAFRLEEERDVRQTLRLAPAALQDALSMTYRGARRSDAAAIASLAAQDVTFSWRVAVFAAV